MRLSRTALTRRLPRYKRLLMAASKRATARHLHHHQSCASASGLSARPLGRFVKDSELRLRQSASSQSLRDFCDLWLFLRYPRSGQAHLRLQSPSRPLQWLPCLPMPFPRSHLLCPGELILAPIWCIASRTWLMRASLFLPLLPPQHFALPSQATRERSKSCGHRQ